MSFAAVVAHLCSATQVQKWVDLLSKAVLATIAALGAGYTALQYWRTKRWRAGDLSAAVILQLETDDEMAFACRAIDWGVGLMMVPERYRPLMERIPEGRKNPTPVERGEVIHHDTELMARAVQVNLTVVPETEPGGLVYRYCFDKLFAHLANVHRLLQAHQVNLDDLVGLKYWLQRIAVYEYAPLGLEGDQVFQPFLKYEPYGYRGVIDLGERLGVSGWKNT